MKSKDFLINSSWPSQESICSRNWFRVECSCLDVASISCTCPFFPQCVRSDTSENVSTFAAVLRTTHPSIHRQRNKNGERKKCGKTQKIEST